jgi:hypothetical protein
MPMSRPATSIAETVLVRRVTERRVSVALDIDQHGKLPQQKQLSASVAIAGRAGRHLRLWSRVAEEHVPHGPFSVAGFGGWPAAPLSR